MRGAGTLIPARFLTLLAHFCVLITLLWESKESVRLCLPIQYHYSHFQIHHSRLVAGLATSIALIIVESVTFIFGLTMFSPSVSLTSIASHGFGAIFLTYFVIDGWICDWFWPIFSICSALPFCVDIITAFVAHEQEHLTKTHKYQAGWSFYLVLAGAVTTFGSSLPVGYNIGVVNTPAEIIKTFCNESFIDRYGHSLNDTWLDVLWSFVVSIFIVGGCTGSILGSVLADKLGRKNATITTNLLSIASALLFLVCRSANSIEMLVLGRFLIGLSGGLTTSIVPMYLTELAPPSLTGTMGAACPMGINVGVLVGQVMGLKFFLGGVNDWPYLLSVYAILVILCLPILCILPESPKYLFVVRRNEAAAVLALSRLRGVAPSILNEELELLKGESRAVLGSRGEKWGMMRVIRDPRLRLPLLLVCSMQAGQQTSGINAVFYYSQTIFKQAGLTDENAQYATIGCGAINVCTAILMLKLLPKTGRRPLLLGSILAATIILACLAVAMSFIDALTWMPYVCMAAVLAYVLVYGFGLGPIPYFIASEMLAVGPRPGGMAWGSLANWAGNFAVGMSFPSLRAALGPACFLLFALATAGLLLFQRFYFPETLGKTPAQVTQLCSRGFRSRPLDGEPLETA